MFVLTRQEGQPDGVEGPEDLSEQFRLLDLTQLAGSTYNNEGQPGVLRRIFDWGNVTSHKGPFNINAIMDLITRQSDEIGVQLCGGKRRT